MCLTHCDVVIVGGGLSGLTTAFHLAEKDPHLRVIILEKRQRLGGVCTETKLGELGGKFIRKEHHEVWDLTDKLGVEFVQREIKYRWRDFSEWKGIKGALAKFELIRFVLEMDELCQGYNPKRNVKRWNKTMEQFIKEKLFFQQSQDFIRFIIKAVFGVKSSILRVDEFLSVCFTCFTFSHLIDSLFEADYIPDGGWSRIVENLVAFLPESFQIFREKCVTQIIEMHARRVMVYTHHGDHFQAKVIVIACPWQSIKQIKFIPQLWPNIMYRIKHLEAYVTTFTLKYEAAAWKQNGHTGSLFDYKNNLYCYETEPCTLKGAWYHNAICETSQHILPDITQILAKTFGDGVLIPVEHETKVFEHQILINFPTMETNRGTIVWATTNNSTRFRGFINGAIHSGMKAATATLGIIRPSVVEYYDEMDSDDARHESVGVLGRTFMSLNIASSVRVAKVVTIASLGYFLFQRYLKDYANEFAQKFLKGSN